MPPGRDPEAPTMRRHHSGTRPDMDLLAQLWLIGGMVALMCACAVEVSR